MIVSYIMMNMQIIPIVINVGPPNTGNICREQKHKKVLQHMPLIPRLEHMFQVHYLAELMDWHAKNYSSDDVIHIHVDGKAWRFIENKWPEFKSES